ncbi:MAG: hypothetical protein R6U19_06505 [Bacteroidales bacterium]
MESIPAKVNRVLKKKIQRMPYGNTVWFMTIIFLFAITGACLWGGAAIGSSRPFRSLALITPLLISYAVYLFTRQENRRQQLGAGLIMFLFSFLLGKYIIFSHFYSLLPQWIGISQMSHIETALAYLPYIFNKTHSTLFLSQIDKMFDITDMLWLLAGGYVIYRYQWFSTSEEKQKKKSAKTRKYFNRRFQ